MKSIRYFLEAIFVWLLMGFFRMLGMERASRVGSWLARNIGPKLKAHKTAYANLKRAFPRKREETLQKILTGMWDNLGRTAGEFIFVSGLVGERFKQHVDVRGEEHVQRVLKRKKTDGFILFSGHFANWEIGPQTAYTGNYPLMLVYRPANYPFVNKMIQQSRLKTLTGMYPKGLVAARHIVASLRNNKPVGMLVDQKMNEGMPLPFFGQMAMTPTALAEYGKKYNTPLMPARVIRKKNCQFVVEILPPLNIAKKSTMEVMLEVNQLFERWITEHPEQWFWVHNRWG